MIVVNLTRGSVVRQVRAFMWSRLPRFRKDANLTPCTGTASFAALVRAIANLYQLPATPTDLSKIARQGSGSACRSLFGGYAGWQKGEQDDGSDHWTGPM